MNLLGETVKHKQFGHGVITDITENKITVCFAKSQKLFLYPDAFPQFLTLKNNSIQKKIEKLNAQRLLGIKEKKDKENRINNYKNRIYTMKIPERSQAAFDIPEVQIHELKNLDYLETGYYLNGDMKGKPRTPSSLQPNSAILLTGCGNADENDRCILGVAMVCEHFWGNECKDGRIRLHKHYKLILPLETHLSFWNYFKRDSCPVRWGRIPFKYLQNITMQKIILEICQIVSGTEQGEVATEFYHYYSSINRLPEIQKTDTI